MQIKINSCGISDCASDWKWNTGSAGFGDYDLWAVFRGNGTLRATYGKQTEEFSVREGACLLLSPGWQYEGEHNSTNPLFVINVHFIFTDKTGKPCFPVSAPIVKYMTSLSFFRTLLMRTVSFFNGRNSDTAALFLHAALAEFQTTESFSDAAEAPGNWTRIIREICEEIDCSKKAPSLAEFAGKYGYSERYIGRIFQKIMNLSFSEYIFHSRISRAKVLLISTDEPVTAIAEEIGFYDACHFIKSFKKAVGIPPSVFRKQKNNHY